LKYKKCCLKLPSHRRPVSVPVGAVLAAREEKPGIMFGKAAPGGVPIEILQEFRQANRAQRAWTALYGHIRPCISADFHGRKFVAAGSKLYYSDKNKWNYVSDFLVDYVPNLFGREWFETEKAKPEADRHPVFQWRVDGVRYMQDQPRQPDGSYVVHVPSGPLAAYQAFAFNLFAIEDNGRLDDLLLERLKNTDQFQGARHEVFAEATCLRAGFLIEHEDQQDRARRHAEFTATHKSTGQRISVEAKSKHRAGVLGHPGAAQPYEKLSLRFGGLLNDALAKNPPFPLVVFLDTNLPFHSAERVLGWDPKEPGKPSRVMRTLIDRDRKEHGGKDLYAMLIFTNHPHHYVGKNEPDPRKHILAIMPLTLQGILGQALADLYKAANLYGNIPNEFPRR